MTAEDFAFLAQMLRKRSGLVLPEKKAHLAEGRLRPVMRRFGFKGVEALLGDLRAGHEALAQAVTEAMTVNDSAFFRDRKTFDELRDLVLPPLLAERAALKRLRIWCAACASGQEAYSVAMMLADRRLAEQGWTIELIASDINSAVVARGEEGLYTQFEVQRGLSIRRLIANFTQEGTQWRIAERLRRAVTFRTFNLLGDYGWLGRLDIILCRNVLMYFDTGTRAQVLEEIAGVLAPEGALLLGPAETIADLATPFAPVDDAPGLYRKVKTPLLLQRAG